MIYTAIMDPMDKEMKQILANLQASVDHSIARIQFYKKHRQWIAVANAAVWYCALCVDLLAHRWTKAGGDLVSYYLMPCLVWFFFDELIKWHRMYKVQTAEFLRFGRWRLEQYRREGE